MTEFRTVTDRVSVAPQIDAADIDTAANEGFTLIVNNRPDGEVPGQPDNNSLQQYAEEKGLKWLHIPIVPGELTMDAVTQSAKAFTDSDKTLAFCRSGTRSCTVWGLAAAYAGTNGIEDILVKAQVAGYDLSGLTPTLQQLEGASSK